MGILFINKFFLFYLFLFKVPISGKDAIKKLSNDPVNTHFKTQLSVFSKLKTLIRSQRTNDNWIGKFRTEKWFHHVMAGETVKRY